MININLKRVESKVAEIFCDIVDEDLKNYPEDNIAMMKKSRELAALALMMKCGLDAADSYQNVTDGFNDLNLDAIYLDESQKKLFVVQSKWNQSGTGSIKHEYVSCFAGGIEHLLNLDLEGANEKVQFKKEDIAKALNSFGYQICSIFIHTGETSSNEYPLSPIINLINKTNDECSEILLFEEISFKSIYEYLSNGQENNQITLDDVVLSEWGYTSTPYPIYYGMLPAASIGEWYGKFGNRLFEKNIRFYKGNTDVNEGIKKTLLTEPQKFLYYNNGIKFLCKHVGRKAASSSTNEVGFFELDGVSLVNGAQTAGTIGEVYKENPEPVKQAKIFTQIIDISTAEPGASIVITKLSNTQNRIENKDFASLDPEQERIRKELMFNNVKYLYKAGDVLNDLSTELTFDEALVSLACYNSDVLYSTTAKRNIGALTEDVTKAPYKVIFNSGTNSLLVINSVKINRLIDKLLTKKSQLLEKRSKLVCIQGNRFIAHCLFQTLKKKIDLSNSIIDIDHEETKISQYVDKFVDEITKIIDAEYADSYPGNIFKNNTKCKNIEMKLFEIIKD